MSLNVNPSKSLGLAHCSSEHISSKASRNDWLDDPQGIATVEPGCACEQSSFTMS